MRPTFIHRYPVASFYILALALGAGTVYLVVQGVFPSSLALGAALSASIAGTIMTAVEDGRAGLKLMLGRLLMRLSSSSRMAQKTYPATIEGSSTGHRLGRKRRENPRSTPGAPECASAA